MQIPAGAVPVFADAPNPLAGKLSPTKTEEDRSSPPVAKKPDRGGGGLFDEGDDDLFGSDG